AGVPLGLLTSTGAVALVRWAMPDVFLSWGWRIPFLLSALLIVVGFVIRKRLLETPLFRRLQEAGQAARDPVREVLRRHWAQVLLAAGARVSENSCFYLFAIYVVTYVEKILAITPSPVLGIVCAAAAIEFFTIPLFGVLSDSWSRKGV